MIVKERLAFQEEVNKLEGFGVLCIGDIKSFIIDIHVIISCQLNHVPVGGIFRWIHVPCVVMVLFGTLKSFLERFVYVFTLLF